MAIPSSSSESPVRAEIARVVIEKKRENPETGEMEVYERVVIESEYATD